VIYNDSLAATTLDMEVEPSIQRLPASALLRSYLVYTFCSFSTIVDHSSTILKMLTNSPIPGLAPLAEFVVRHTFFAQFCGGEDAQDCKKVMRSLRDEGKAVLLSYSVEADEDELTGDLDANGEKGELMAKHHLEEYFRAVEALGDFEDETMRMTGHRAGTWVAVKLVSLMGIGSSDMLT
jgi:proline dehydrogenase